MKLDWDPEIVDPEIDFLSSTSEAQLASQKTVIGRGLEAKTTCI